uniref:DNA topoisomerase (ATP-hydrolyzing) n=1 Tax=viral metagenome TaxID=1070528 RepID=A0A6C0LLU5_9ZZZZ
MASADIFTIENDIKFNLHRTANSGVFERVHKKYAIKSNLKDVYKTVLEHSPCLLKCIDEGIVNASDQILKKNKVTEINVNIDQISGIITIRNNGKGIPHKVHKDGSKFLDRKIRTPELIFTNFRCGSNLDDDESGKGRDTGGCNGIGIKLAVIHSDWFRLETVSKKDVYKQKFEMNLSKMELDIEPPTIEPYEDESYTQIEFLPHYKRFGYSNPPSKNDMIDLIDILRYRVYHLAIFLHNKKVVVTFNGEEFKTEGVKSLIDSIEPDGPETYPIIKTKSDSKEYIDYAIKVRTGKFITTSIVNGVVVSDGTHITHLTRAINIKLKELQKDKDKDKKLDCKNYLCVVATGNILIKNWGNQSKDKLEMRETDFKDFTFKDSVITKISKEIMEKSKVVDLKKAIKPKVDKKAIYDKYTAAKKLKGDTTLFIAEGDSAMLLLKRILAKGGSKYTSDNTGIFSLGGVPSNIAKGITEDVDEEGDTVELASEKFYESKVFGALVQCLKIDPTKTYKTKEELKSLSYNKIVICVDADLDGIGNICSLVLQVFYRLWPNIFKHGILNIWNSPILRVTNNSGKVLKEFKFEQEFKKWQPKMPKDAKIAYIKGLAGHDDKYIKSMSERFDSDLVKIKSGKDTKSQFEVYFGKDSSSRKEVLATPVVDFSVEEIYQMNNEQYLLCDRHLDKNTKEFQIYAMQRTLPGLDNLTPVRRKCFTSFYKHNQTSPMKVFQAGGRVAFEYLYHHGDASIQGAIIKMTHKFPGSNMIPLLIGDGQLGSRNRKGKDAGEARYVGASLNKKIAEAMFRKDDFPILLKSFSDGIEVEPKYYIPTLPLPILEFQKSVSYAWSLNVYPRDIKAVCDVLKKLCKDEEITEKDKNLPLSKEHFKGKLKFKTVEEVEKVYMKGKYEQLKEGKTDVFHITELPLTVTPKAVELALIADEDIVSDIFNHTTDEVSIKVELKPGAIDKIPKKYGSIDKFLRLECYMKEHINFINEHGIIEQFDTAYKVLKRCFDLNKNKYKLKIDRELLLLIYKIVLEQNVIKFIECDEIEKIKKKEDAEINKILDEDKFDRINSTILNTESKYTTDELIEKLELNKKFDYLMSIRVSDVTKQELDKRNKHLEEMLKRQKQLEEQLKEKPFAGSKQYMDDIDNAYNIVHAFNTANKGNKKISFEIDSTKADCDLLSFKIDSTKANCNSLSFENYSIKADCDSLSFENDSTKADCDLLSSGKSLW